MCVSKCRGAGRNAGKVKRIARAICGGVAGKGIIAEAMDEEVLDWWHVQMEVGGKA